MTRPSSPFFRRDIAWKDGTPNDSVHLILLVFTLTLHPQDRGRPPHRSDVRPHLRPGKEDVSHPAEAEHRAGVPRQDVDAMLFRSALMGRGGGAAWVPKREAGQNERLEVNKCFETV